MAANKLVLFESLDKSISLNVPLRNDSVWLNRNQMAELFDRDVKTIGKHVNNAIREELDGLPVVAKFATTAADGKTYMVDYYELDVIISVGYRVKSQRGVEFRKWANSVLRQYIMQGYAINHNRIRGLGEVVRVMKRTQNSLDARQVLAVIERYSTALDLLDDYDHQTISKPTGNQATGNKRIAATMFLYFLDRNNALFIDRAKRIDDYTLVALTIMIAESKPDEKEMMIKVIMNCMG